MKSLHEKYSETFQQWILRSSSHGIPNMFRTRNRFVRVMWLAFFLSSFGYCVVSIAKSIHDYAKHQITISIERVQELPQVFPAVTLCNLNPYNNANNQTVEYLRVFYNSLSDPECLNFFKRNATAPSPVCTSPIKLNVQKLKRHIANLFLRGSFVGREEIGYDLARHMLLTCKFNGELCFERNFTKFWSNEYGFCYTFNGDRDSTLRTSNKGANSGLEMELAVKSPSKNPIFGISTGLYLAVSNQSSAPITLNNGITLPTGKQMIVDVNRVFSKKLPDPFSNCIDELKSANPYSQQLFEYFRFLNISYYDQDLCFNLCYQDKLIDRCNCSNLITPAIRSTVYCYTDCQLKCLYAFDRQYFRSDLNEFCERGCPQKCNSIEYKLSVQFSSYPTLDRIHVLNKSGLFPFVDNTPEAEMESIGKKALLRVTINYENTYYTLVKENPAIRFEALLGSVGGQLGLFIGISFLSIIELLELAIDLFYVYKEHSIKKDMNSF